MGVSAVKAIASKMWEHKFSVGINAGFGMMSFNDNINEGNGVAASIGGALLDTALPMVMGTGYYLGLQAAQAIPSAAISAYEMSADYGRTVARSSNMTFANSQFQDTQQFSTMRQAGKAMMEQSKYNEQHALLGDEARHMHR